MVAKMNSSKPKIFIQSNEKQRIGALLSKHSLVSNSRNPEAFDVVIMQVEDYPAMMKFDGKSYWKSGVKDTWEKNDLQSFTMTRFLPPQLMNFSGRALVIDPDVFALPGTDVMDLLGRDMLGKAVLACDAGNGKFKSSVMLLDCAKLKHWNWDQCLEEVFSGAKDYRKWVQLSLEPAGSVGILEEEWNHCDVLNEKTKMIHFTRRLTQPWKTGLKVDFKHDITPSKYSFLPRPVINALRSLLGKNTNPKYYQTNPDPKQAAFFFNLTKEAVSAGVLNQSILARSIEQGHLRKDFMQTLEQASPMQ
jgi:hypothetical protein